MIAAIADTAGSSSSGSRPVERARVAVARSSAPPISTSSPPPGPAIHPVVFARALALAGLVIALDLAGWGDALARTLARLVS